LAVLLAGALPSYLPEKVHGGVANSGTMLPPISKGRIQQVSIGFLVLAGIDILIGQKPLAMIFAGVAIALSLGAGYLTRGSSKSGKGR
jgi:hypothetical protein